MSERAQFIRADRMEIKKIKGKASQKRERIDAIIKDKSWKE